MDGYRSMNAHRIPTLDYINYSELDLYTRINHFGDGEHEQQSLSYPPASSLEPLLELHVPAQPKVLWTLQKSWHFANQMDRGDFE